MMRIGLGLLILISLNACTNREVSDKNEEGQVTYKKLPIGSVKPAGWLKDQLTIQANGLTGHLDEFWPDLKNSSWKGGNGEAWELGPYYLDGLVPLAYLMDDQRLIEKSEEWMSWIIKSSNENGWFGPEKNEDRWPLAVALKALRSYYEATGNDNALDVIKNYFRYLNQNKPDWPDDTWRGVRAMENAVTGFWLFDITADSTVLEAVKSIAENSFDWTNYFYEFPWDSVALKNDSIPHNWEADGLTAHVVNIGMAVKYPGLLYRLTGDPNYKHSVYAGIRNLEIHHGQAAGRFSGDEHLSGKHPSQGTELCSIVEYMFSLENLYFVFKDPVFADRLELLAYNAFPGTLTPDYWAHQYDQQSNQVLVDISERQWSTNGPESNIYGLMPNYGCCLANMHQGWPRYTEHMWMKTSDGGLAVNTYGPNVVETTLKGKPVRITQNTNYPFDGTITLQLKVEGEHTFPVYIRVPG